jgi:hypothetical protein
VAVDALRLAEGEGLGVIGPVQAQAVVKDDAWRWGMEIWLGIVTTRGFCLAATHLTDEERLSQWFALLTLALCWAMRTGLWWLPWQPIELQKHGRRAKSLFRLGLDY